MYDLSTCEIFKPLQQTVYMSDIIDEFYLDILHVEIHADMQALQGNASSRAKRCWKNAIHLALQGPVVVARIYKINSEMKLGNFTYDKSEKVKVKPDTKAKKQKPTPSKQKVKGKKKLGLESYTAEEIAEVAARRNFSKALDETSRVEHTGILLNHFYSFSCTNVPVLLHWLAEVLDLRETFKNVVGEVKNNRSNRLHDQTQFDMLKHAMSQNITELNIKARTHISTLL